MNETIGQQLARNLEELTATTREARADYRRETLAPMTWKGGK